MIYYMVTPLFITDHKYNNYHLFTKQEIKLFEEVINKVVSLKKYLERMSDDSKEEIDDTNFIEANLSSYELARVLLDRYYNIDYINSYTKKIVIKLSNDNSILKFKFKRYIGILHMSVKLKTLKKINISELNFYENMYYSNSQKNYINIYYISYYFDISNIKNLNSLIIFLIFKFIFNITLN